MINGLLIYIGILVAATILFFVGIAISIQKVEAVRRDCEVIAGGHFINSRGYECWSLDGTRRLFPSDAF